MRKIVCDVCEDIDNFVEAQMDEGLFGELDICRICRRKLTSILLSHCGAGNDSNKTLVIAALKFSSGKFQV